MPSPKRQLMEHTYDGDLAADIRNLRTAGRTWRQIAPLVSTRCGYDVSYESLRLWYGEKDAA
jgi:hypothetical protein